MTMTPVGVTAQWIAAARALETESETPLYSDPLARALAGEAGFAMLDAMRAPAGNARTPDAYLSIRTKFLDDALLSAVRERSIQQVVILAAGMDARAFRLDWPAGVVVFEVDRADIFDYKEPAIASANATARCDRRVVRADLAAEWVEHLDAAGFDRSRPTAFLVEGLLPYLDHETVVRFLRTLATQASDGSWIGVDVNNREVLTSPYFASTQKKLHDYGCPWRFGVGDPEKFFLSLGWKVTACTPGEPQASYGRWPYPVPPRSIPGLPRVFFIVGTRTAAEGEVEEVPPVVSAPDEPYPYQRISEPGIEGAFHCPDGAGPFPAVLALGGSDGGVPDYYLDMLVKEGFACLALAYFGTDATQPALVDVPLERIERGLRWLVAHPKAAAAHGRLGVLGTSKGGELALLTASTFPDLVGPVVAYTPSSVVWAGIDYSSRVPISQASWSHHGRSLPSVPYPQNVAPVMTAKGFQGLPIYVRGLENAAAVAEASIPVERATGPLLLISGGDDHMWPATRMCEMVVERMRAHGRGDAVTHLDYPEAGHILMTLSSRALKAPPMPFDLGGAEGSGDAAHADAWPRVVALLKGIRSQ